MVSRAPAIAVTVVRMPNNYTVQFTSIKFPFLFLPLPRLSDSNSETSFSLDHRLYFLGQGFILKTWGLICRNVEHVTCKV